MDSAEREAFRKNASEALTELHGALVREIGPEQTAQVAEYIEHHEFGLALELLVSLVIVHGLDGRAYEGGVEALFKAMGMDDSEYASRWRDHLGEA
jgi:hypothetical protein